MTSLGDELSFEDEIAIASVELAIEDLIREVDELIDEWVDDVDRTLVIRFMCMAYVHGYMDATEAIKNLTLGTQ